MIKCIINGLLTFFFIQTIQAQSIIDWKYDDLEARIEKGKDTTYIINFWATWCRPCVAELPYFEALATEIKDQKVKIILMSVDFPKEKETTLIPFVVNRKLQNEVGLWIEMNENEWIDKVAKEWSGALPGTWVRNVSLSHRKFYEKNFHSLEELKAIIPQ